MRTMAATTSSRALASGSGMPIQMDAGTRQQFMWRHRPYAPASGSMLPKRISPCAMNGASSCLHAAPVALHCGGARVSAACACSWGTLRRGYAVQAQQRL